MQQLQTVVEISHGGALGQWTFVEQRENLTKGHCQEHALRRYIRAHDISMRLRSLKAAMPGEGVGGIPPDGYFHNGVSRGKLS